ncbi:aminotransferase class IV [Mucisphaera sp.]|uniref:aminotransferase class IV n=1 Tax=Mucisphaera sp. TaxID=2913024 RepID=UPI003D0DECB4
MTESTPQPPTEPTYRPFLNGAFVEADEAKICLDDAGFQHGIGLFETLAVRHGHAFRKSAHLERLAGSARDLGLAEELDLDALATAIDKTIEHNHLQEARLRLTLTAGPINLLPGRQNARKPLPTLAIQPAPPTNYDPQYFEKGILVLIAPSHANPLDPTTGHKTLNYWQRLRSLRQAAAAGAGEALWLSVTNHLACGSISNIFLVKDGRLLTPIARGEEPQGGLAAPVLPGITRAAVIECAETAGIPFDRQMLSIDDLLDADEVFLTNSGWQVLPVNQIEKETIGEGQAGPITNQLRKALLDLIKQEAEQA